MHIGTDSAHLLMEHYFVEVISRQIMGKNREGMRLATPQPGQVQSNKEN